MNGRYSKFIWTVILIALAYAIARVGRMCLDHVLTDHPSWGATGERLGGSLIGLLVVCIALVPMLKLYGIFDGSGFRPPAAQRKVDVVVGVLMIFAGAPLAATLADSGIKKALWAAACVLAGAFVAARAWMSAKPGRSPATDESVNEEATGGVDHH